MINDERRRAWLWLRVHGATPAEAVYLAHVHRNIDPGHPRDLPAAGDLLTQHRTDNQRGGVR